MGYEPREDAVFGVTFDVRGLSGGLREYCAGFVVLLLFMSIFRVRKTAQLQKENSKNTN